MSGHTAPWGYPDMTIRPYGYFPPPPLDDVSRFCPRIEIPYRFPPPGPRFPFPPPQLPHGSSNQNPGQSTPNFLCKPCGLSFYSKFKLEQHVAQHAQCPLCGLTASARAIEDHISNQHMLVNFADLQIDDEAWIAERKKRFPSARRAELRSAEQQEKFKRGERLGEERGRFGKRGSRGNRGRGRGSEGRSQERGDGCRNSCNNKAIDNKFSVVKMVNNISFDNKQCDSVPSAITSCNGIVLEKMAVKDAINSKGNTRKRPMLLDIDLDDSDEEIKYGVPAFKGSKWFYEQAGEISVFAAHKNSIAGLGDNESNIQVSNLYEQKDVINTISDEEDTWASPVSTDKTTGNNTVLTLTLCNALGSLMGSYNSDSDQGEQLQEGKKQFSATSNLNKDSQASRGRKRRRQRRNNKVDVSVSQNDTSKTLNDDVINPPVSHGRKPCSGQLRQVKRRKPTLLQRLLEPDIRHERNVLLQCIRFITKNNFFHDSNEG